MSDGRHQRSAVLNSRETLLARSAHHASTRQPGTWHELRGRGLRARRSRDVTQRASDPLHGADRRLVRAGPDRGVGCRVQSVRLRDYRRHLGVVLQDNFLFDGTIIENIKFSNPEANLEEIKEVCRIANADEFIAKFPNGYDTIVGERGVKLSGGQRQRIAIARALLANPRILILDEATSSLDSESEALIQEGLNRLRQGRTTFVIAHRLSTIRSADQILVVEAGEILERGTHEELISLEGRYKQLYDKQYRFEQNLFVNPGEDFTTKAPESMAQTKL